MCRHEIVAASGGIPRRKLGADKFDALQRQRGAEQPLASYLQHSGARVHASHSRFGISREQRREKFSVSFTDKQRILEAGDFVPKRIATSLELAARQEHLHPVIMPGEPVELRGW